MNIAAQIASSTGPAGEPWPSLHTICAWISDRAAESESRPTGLDIEIDRLREAGLLTACLPKAFGGSAIGLEESTAGMTFDILRWLGRASLPVARLFEGHMNALKLVALYGSPSQQNAIFEKVATHGRLLGVWAADGAKPVTYALRDDGSVLLHGQKAFASGLGCVSDALITASPTNAAGRGRLLLVEVTSACRQDKAAWRANGMKATLSGTVNFDDVPAPTECFIGESGDYEKEPHFDGGVWRYCAAHIGGAEGLINASLEVAELRRQLNDPLQQHRFGQAIAKCRAAASLVREWATRVEASVSCLEEEARQAAAGAILARSVVYDMCVDVLQLCERGIGTAAHMDGTTIDRLRRDLSLYIRQAAPDAKFLRATDQLLQRPDRDQSLW
jgi:alkylation response protein AidB-like acyl-CoA dehydrogenase